MKHSQRFWAWYRGSSRNRRRRATQTLRCHQRHFFTMNLKNCAKWKSFWWKPKLLACRVHVIYEIISSFFSLQHFQKYCFIELHSFIVKTIIWLQQTGVKVLYCWYWSAQTSSCKISPILKKFSQFAYFNKQKIWTVINNA